MEIWVKKFSAKKNIYLHQKEGSARLLPPNRSLCLKLCLCLLIYIYVSAEVFMCPVVTFIFFWQIFVTTGCVSHFTHHSPSPQSCDCQDDMGMEYCYFVVKRRAWTKFITLCEPQRFIVVSYEVSIFIL